jgi:hypothetical protein
MTGSCPAAMGNADAANRLRADIDLGRQPSDSDKLALIAAGFPAFHLWRATIYDRIRYIAQGASLDTHPYAVVTADLDELHAALTAGQQDCEQ